MFLISSGVAILILFSLMVFLFVPPKWRWLWLLFISVALLATAGWFGVGVAAAETLFAFLMGLWLEKRNAKILLALSVFGLLAPLVYFKMGPSVPLAAESFSVVGLPIGLSFYTFQLLSYVIDVFQKRRPAEKHLGRFALFSLLFCTKINGPIERADLLDQLKEIVLPQGPALYRAGLFIWLGLFQKFVLADHLASFVDPVFQKPSEFSGFAATLAVLLSKYQIFCDFSGGSQIALGLGGLFGLRLTQNFARPFAAVSLRDFWKRWHISLQTWIREYVFVPLLSTPIARLGLFPILLVTFVVFGLWHDFRWTFVLYGAIQAVLLWLEPERLFARLRSPRWRPLILAFNYVVLICLPSVLFRTASVSQAVDIWSALGVSGVHVGDLLDQTSFSFAILAALMVAHELFLWLEERKNLFERVSRRHWTLRLVLAFSLIVVLVLFAKAQPSPFVYSRF